MTGHRKWSEIRNPTLEDPAQRRMLQELRWAGDSGLALAGMREQWANQSEHGLPGSSSPLAELIIHESEYLAALRASVEELGGKLEVAAVFPDQRIRLIPDVCDDSEA